TKYFTQEGKCRFKPGTIGADDKGFVDLDQGNETSLMLAIASQGPVSVAMDAGHKSFLHYNKGIYYEPLCSSSELDHGVLAVGYGSTDDGKDYWLIKNSWSTEWGEQGYVRIARNRDNHCGVASQASYPQV
uniref:Peptidase C1A papain C-terminal domain-containing protein n=1 Tax=Romanomermis culicivorax TaxID=13658 RepID=A0A915IL20_ROMCU